VKKDNEFVYHDRVRNADTLPDVKGASLVKPLPFEPTNASVTGPDIFAKLVPLEAHLAASTYRCDQSTSSPVVRRTGCAGVLPLAQATQ